jgi:hypothetical protein
LQGEKIDNLEVSVKGLAKKLDKQLLQVNKKIDEHISQYAKSLLITDSGPANTANTEIKDLKSKFKILQDRMDSFVLNPVVQPASVPATGSTNSGPVNNQHAGHSDLENNIQTQAQQIQILNRKASGKKKIL